MANNDSDKKEHSRPIKPGEKKFSFAFVLAGLVVLLVLFVLQPGTNSANEMSYTEFLARVGQNQVDSIRITGNSKIQGVLRDVRTTDGLFYTWIPFQDPALPALLSEHGVRVTGGPETVSIWYYVLQFAPTLLIIVFFFFMMRQSQGQGNRAFQFGKVRAHRYEGAKKITFADVAGQEEAKHELQEVVEFLKNPQKFVKMGARIPKGVLLVGMPGTGKTMLARAVAGEADVAYFSISGSDFVEMFVGVGASRVRDLFEQGRKSAPCIIFIDELDAVGRTRGAGYGGGHDEREQTLNQMLVEMDGFETKDGVIILAATNRPDVLDPALLRPGRFDRQVVVAMPDIKEREAILRIHAQKIPLDESVDLQHFARATSGMSGADLANLVNEAALFAARKDRQKVESGDFEEARDKLLMGIARHSMVMPEKDRRMTAVHESGHALLHYYLKNADPLHKVTIVPRGQALGLAVSLPETDSYSRTKGWLSDRICICYGGFVAETLVYGETTTGTRADLQTATDIARRMVCEFGMSPEIGPVAWGQEDEPVFIGKEIARKKDFSEETARTIDAAVKSILDQSRALAESVIRSHREELDRLSEELLLRETLEDSEVRKLLGLPEKNGGAAE
ncbi:MAG TPA: ATP-dependent zinc metalloprotease FtsH [Treponemataceae bacterium]|jgi:cell division protease FtsH|nr:MAG: ATP-dependent zinc metalloprotease FtsH [Spirochaetes bacterium ADurb.Bin269]HOC29027.1 ATP-dependent zinc metalloprotease FtsH [Treponemataceae bacterium]HQL33233.1 ATP-dependent zinc metalloprotease FtsH [Treponemataceae bacterium]